MSAALRAASTLGRFAVVVIDGRARWQRNEGAVDDAADREARQRDGGRGEGEWNEAGAPAGDDQEHDPSRGVAAEGAGDERGGEGADAEAGPVEAEQAGVGVQVVGDVDGKGVLDGA